MMQQHWRQLLVKNLCQQSSASGDKILESRATNQTILPTLSSTSTLKDARTVSQSLNANGRPVLSSVIACSITLLLISSYIGIADAEKHVTPLSKRDYLQVGCKGTYDSSMFARLDRVCDDCYNLFRHPLLYKFCRDDCFTTWYFEGCVQSLYLQDELEQIKFYVKYLHGANPGF